MCANLQGVYGLDTPAMGLDLRSWFFQGLVERNDSGELYELDGYFELAYVNPSARHVAMINSAITDIYLTSALDEDNYT